VKSAKIFCNKKREMTRTPFVEHAAA